MQFPNTLFKPVRTLPIGIDLYLYFNHLLYTQHRFLCCSCYCLCCICNIVFQITLERDVQFRGHLVEGHMQKVFGLNKPALKLCWPVGQSTKVLLPYITLLPPPFVLQLKLRTLQRTPYSSTSSQMAGTYLHIELPLTEPMSLMNLMLHMSCFINRCKAIHLNKHELESTERT